MVDIFKEKLAAKNAKSPGVKIVVKFIHPLLSFEFHKKVLNTSGITWLR